MTPRSQLTRTYPLEQINVPTVVVHGTADPMVPFERHAVVLASRIRGAELVDLVDLEGGEHPAIFSHRDDEQEAVVEHIARKTARIDSVRAATERTLSLLMERRATLIAAAVTGQIDLGSTGLPCAAASHNGESHETA